MMLLQPVTPDKRETLMPHQDEAADVLLQHLGNGSGTGVLMGMGPRLGKSVATVEAVARSGKQRVLVVSPVTIIDGWVEEIHKWWTGDEMPYRTCHGFSPGDEIHGWTFTNYETIRKFSYRVNSQRWETYWPTGWDVIVLDESVKIKNRDAQLTKAITALVVANPNAAIWLLSGNPAPKDLSDLFSQLWLVDRETTGNSYWAFVQRYCIIEQTQWGAKIAGNQPGAEERLKADYAHCFWSPANAPALTPVVLRVDEVEMRAEQRRIYVEMEVQFRALLDTMSGHEILAPNVMVQGIRLLQIASSPALLGGPLDGVKWRHAARMLLREELPRPTIIWTAFIETVRQYGQCLTDLGFRVEHLSGSTSPARRTEVRHAFQAGELDILLAHPGVGRFGLNLSAANSVIWLEKSWQGDDYYQAGFRARHLQREDEIQVVDILATADQQATIDHAVHNMLQRRTQSSKTLTASDFRNNWIREGLDREIIEA